MSKRSPRLWFGIPDLDGLIRPPSPTSSSDGLDNVARTTVLCLQGPVGSGKSTLALHLAARYAEQSETGQPNPCILFLSTDWREDDAKDLWTEFHLADRGSAAPPGGIAEFETSWRSHENSEPTQAKSRRKSRFTPLTASLEAVSDDSGPTALADWLEHHTQHLAESDCAPCEVGFLDLSRIELGDEWTFVERLMGHVAGLRDEFTAASCPNPRSLRPHMVIIDSIPGLETASGSKDVFGQEVSTQERINRLIKVLRDQAHLVFTSAYEDSAEAARREEAQADIVYRLDFDVRNGVPLRTITVTKARGYDHSIQPHTIEFVSPGGATFSSRRPDRDVRGSQIDPITALGFPSTSADATHVHPSYVQVYPTVQWLLSAVKRHRPKDYPNELPLVPLAGSGIKYLDNMLSRAGRPLDAPQVANAASTKPNDCQRSCASGEERPELLFGDRFGVPCGSLTKITGPEQTHKSHLANAFARHSLAIFARYALAVLDHFLSVHGTVESVLRESPGWNSEDWRRHCTSLEKRAAEFAEKAQASGDHKLTLDWTTKLNALRQFLPTPEKKRQATNATGDGISTLDAIIRPLEAAYGSTASTATEALSSSNVVERLAGIVWRIVEDFGPERRVILLTTRYLDFEQAEQSFGAYLRERYSLPLKRISRKLVFLLGDEEVGDAFLGHFAAKASSLWRERVIYRRLVPRDLVPEIFFHVVRRNLEFAAADLCDRLSARPERYDWLQPIVGLANGNPAPQTRRDFEAIGALRVIVDDLQAVQLACAGRDQEYAALCSLLTSYLRMRRVTSILVESSPSDGSRPTASGTPAGRPERFHIIRTSRVRVEGADRVGITIDPALNPDLHGCVRELKVQQGKYLEKIAIVDPDFELYSNLGSGPPAVIPLEVHLLVETPNIDLYCNREESFLATFFRGVPDPQNPGRPAIIQRRPAVNYGLLQDLATYPNPLTATPKTVVVQVDGYWNQSRQGNLRDLHDYLFRDLTPGTEDERRFEDQFRKFEPSLQAEDQGHLDIRSRYGVLDWKRGRGRNLRYISRISDTEGRLDRIPYTWDYGFILIDLPAWNRAIDNLVRVERNSSTPRPSPAGVPLPAAHKEREALLNTIRRIVYTAERKAAGSRSSAGGDNEGYVDWFEFALAAQWVAALEQHRASAAREDTIVSGLATASLRPSSLDCLLLEMWFSEIYSLLMSLGPTDTAPDSPTLANFLSRVSRPDFEPPWRGDDPFGLARGLVGLLHRRTPALLQDDDIGDPRVLASRLLRPDEGDDPSRLYIAKCLADRHSNSRQFLLDELKRRDNTNERIKSALLRVLNRLIRDPSLWHESHFRQVDFRLETRRLIRQHRKLGKHSPQLNRLLLEDVFPQDLRRRDHGHVREQFKAIRSVVKAIQQRLAMPAPEGATLPTEDSEEPLEILRELVRNGFALQLYKCWLLILETFDISSYLPTFANAGPVESARPPVRHAVAVRHWYKTACQATAAIASLPDGHAEWRAIPMPGHFSVRGDWYLGVLKGSRSVRLGELALDVLTDEKANLTRLKLGVGLPVRDVRPDAASVEHTSTGLLKFDANGIPQPVMLGEFLDLTSARSFRTPPLPDADDKQKQPSDPRLSDSADGNARFWLWRSGLGGYDTQCESFRHWIRNLMQWTVDYRVQNLSTWEGSGGKRAYLAISAIEKLAARATLSFQPEEEADKLKLMKDLDDACFVLAKYESYSKFGELCDDLRERLIHITPAREW